MRELTFDEKYPRAIGHNKFVVREDADTPSVRRGHFEPKYLVETPAYELRKFNKNYNQFLYFCAKCEKNHDIRSKIGKAHKRNAFDAYLDRKPFNNRRKDY